MRTLIITLFLSASLLTVSAAAYERFEENGKVGLKDSTGSVILPASFDALGWSDGNFSMIGQITGYRQQNRWGLLNLKKEFITKAQFESLTYPGGDHVIVSKYVNPYTVKFGSINLQGKVVVPYSYDEIVWQGFRARVMLKNGTRYEYGLIDDGGKSVLPVHYQNIQPMGGERFAVQNFSNKIALFTVDGKWITGFTIDRISGFQFGLAVICEGWRQGVIDIKGEIIIKPQYREVRIDAPDHVSARKVDEWKLMDVSYCDLQHLEADELSFDNRGWGCVRLDGKCGLVDEDLQQCGSISYDYVGDIQDHLAVVGNAGKYGLARLDQTQVLPIEFDSLCVEGNFVRTQQWVGGVPWWRLYDTLGTVRHTTRYEFIDRFNGKFFPVRNHGYWGGMGQNGESIIACVYDSLMEISDSLVAVKFKGQYGIITLEDQWRMMPQKDSFRILDADHFLTRIYGLYFMKAFDGNLLYFTDNPLTVYSDHLEERLPDGTRKEINFQGQLTKRTAPLAIKTDRTFRESEGYIGIKRNGKFGFVDSQGRLRIANRYDSIGEFHGGIAPAMLLGKWGFINTSDQIVIQPTFEKVEYFEHGAARVARNGKVGLINPNGEVLLELRYDSIDRLPDQLFIPQLDGLKGLADKNGQVMIEPRFDVLVPLTNGLVIVSRNGQYGVLTKAGDSIFPLQFNRLEYLPEKNIFLTMTESVWEAIEIKN